MTEQENRNILEEYVRCIENDNPEGLYDLVTDDYVEEYPQSGERIRGKGNYQKVYDNFGELPELKGYNLFSCGDLGVAELLLDYPNGGTYNSCHILHFDNGKIAHIRAYFGQPFDAADWRSNWVEMMGDTTEETYETRPTGRR